MSKFATTNAELYSVLAASLVTANNSGPLRLHRPLRLIMQTFLMRSQVHEFVVNAFRSQAEQKDYFSSLNASSSMNACTEGGTSLQLGHQMWVLEEKVQHHIAANTFSGLPTEWIAPFLTTESVMLFQPKDDVAEVWAVARPLPQIINFLLPLNSIAHTRRGFQIYLVYVEWLCANGAGTFEMFNYDALVHLFIRILGNVHTAEASREAFCLYEKLLRLVQRDVKSDSELAQSTAALYFLQSQTAEEGGLHEEAVAASKMFVKAQEVLCEDTTHDTTQLIHGLFSLSFRLLRVLQFEEAVAMSKRAVLEAEKREEPLIIAQAEYRLCWSLEHLSGSSDQALAALKRSIAKMESNRAACGDDELDGMYTHLGSKATFGGNFSDARRFLQKAGTFEHRSIHTRYYYRFSVAELNYFEGNLREALDIIGETIVLDNSDLSERWSNHVTDAFSLERFLLESPRQLAHFVRDGTQDPFWDEEFCRGLAMAIRLVAEKNGSPIKLLSETFRNLQRVGLKTTLPDHRQQYQRTWQAVVVVEE